MKYGESFFDILYLLFAVTAGIVILARRRDRTGILMGVAAIVLGSGDAFHLVPRVLNYFIDSDFTAALGVGKLITSITMTVFYVLMFALHKEVYGKASQGGTLTKIAVILLASVRVLVCLLPGNAWLSNGGSVGWGIARNIPFVALGIIIVVLYWLKRAEDRAFRRVWLYVTLSFLFYIPVAVAAPLVPMLGMLMLPKTICYIFILICFINKSSENPKR